MSALPRATEILAAGTWPVASAVDRIALDYDERHRRRFRYVAAAGTEFLLDLPRAAVLQHGDALLLEDGRCIEVQAAAEALLRISAGSTAALVRLAWHIGNRHLPAQLAADSILIREDHVIEAMLIGLGARVEHVRAAFAPESGAYAHAHSLVLTAPAHGH